MPVSFGWPGWGGARPAGAYGSGVDCSERAWSGALPNLTLNGCYRGIDRVGPVRLAYNDTVRTLPLGCCNQFCNCLGDVVRIGSVGRSEYVHKGLQHLAGDRSNLAVGCARLRIIRLLSRRKHVGRICARLYQHDIDAEL